MSLRRLARQETGHTPSRKHPEWWGVVISDEDTMVFAPVSKNIEAGSETAEKPNAIMLRGSAADALTRAAGADPASEASQGEIGNTALDPARVEMMQADLERNPPVKFDITRRMNVFSSRVVYVEFEIKNFTLSRKQVPLPQDFQTVTNAELRDQITSRLRAPIAQLGAVKVMVGSGDNAREEMIDDKWLRKARKQIEDLYTFQTDNFGRVILKEDPEKFDAAVEEFTAIVSAYHTSIRKALDGPRETFRDNFVSEFLPRWMASPPPYMSHWGRTPDERSLREELKLRADEVFEKMLDFAPPSVRLVEKNVSPNNVEDPKFLEPLRRIMEKRRVPQEIIESLFASGGAAPEQPDFPDLSLR
ncbi:hypothetical protein [Thalassorhabdomicrobium marinisediminis]|uniref:hypothetical protein n=1 Tax=Thalassorhabdomicrobium marinisediminis TaxID=2170577 RepID=UPI0024904C33|nr:hypothetical protein [Thalassorhabdomicrobium marinisediminis]